MADFLCVNMNVKTRKLLLKLCTFTVFNPLTLCTHA